mgnify:CR=1 FL=1
MNLNCKQENGSPVPTNSSVLIAIPAYNEEACISNTICELRRVAPEFDFVVINDGSTDQTLSICNKLDCNVIDMPINCGLTVGFQTVVQLAAGMLDWKWSKYTLVALPGYLAWGFVYAAGGLTLFRSIANGSIGLLILFVIIVLLLWSVGTFLVKKLKPNT